MAVCCRVPHIARRWPHSIGQGRDAELALSSTRRTTQPGGEMDPDVDRRSRTPVSVRQIGEVSNLGEHVDVPLSLNLSSSVWLPTKPRAPNALALRMIALQMGWFRFSIRKRSNSRTKRGQIGFCFKISRTLSPPGSHAICWMPTSQAVRSRRLFWPPNSPRNCTPSRCRQMVCKGRARSCRDRNASNVYVMLHDASNGRICRWTPQATIKNWPSMLARKKESSAKSLPSGY